MRQRFAVFALAILMCCFGVLSALGGLFLTSREAVIVVEREREVQTLLENQILDRAAVNSYAAKVGNSFRLSDKPGDPVGYIQTYRLLFKDMAFSQIHTLATVLMMTGAAQIVFGVISMAGVGLATKAAKDIK